MYTNAAKCQNKVRGLLREGEKAGRGGAEQHEWRAKRLKEKRSRGTYIPRGASREKEKIWQRIILTIRLSRIKKSDPSERRGRAGIRHFTSGIFTAENPCRVLFLYKD